MNLIIDAMNIVFRSHHVYDLKQNLTTKTGVPTGIIYGFLRTLLKWKKKYPHHKIIIAWDSPDSNQKRRDIYPLYKANRKASFAIVEMPEDINTYTSELGHYINEEEPLDVLRFQLGILQRMLYDFGVEQIQAPGYEADDIIATFVRVNCPDDNNIILSSDRDLLQLVTRKTILVTPEGKYYDTEKVIEEYEVSPQNLVTYRSLLGDKSDNLPGLSRVRKKVVAKLVTEKETLESIYKDEIESEGLSENEKKKLKDFQKQAEINNQVMSLMNIPELQIDKGELNSERFDAMCNLLELYTLVGVSNNKLPPMLKFS